MSSSKTGTKSKSQKATNSTLKANLSTSKISKKVTSSLPSGITIVHQKGGSILLEEDYVSLYLIRKLTSAQLKELGATHKIVTNSTRHYRKKYKEQIRKRHHHMYATAMKGNTRGKKEKPGVLLEKDILDTLLKKGWSVRRIATHLKTSAWFVRSSIKYHGLTKSGGLPYRMIDSDARYLEQLERFVPGITEKAVNYYSDPVAFYSTMYEAFTQVIDLLWFIKEQSSGHQYLRETGRVSRDHISWSLNRHEALLSSALLSAGIPHIRQLTFYKNYMADFGFPETKLLVEVDGEFHKNHPETKARDKRKTAAARRLGYRVIRFTTKQVEKELPLVIAKISSELQK